MNRFLSMRRLSILFFGVFAVLVGGAVAFQTFYVAPADACTNSGRWWYEEGRECVQPIYLPDITGRPAGVTRAEASDAGQRSIEHAFGLSLACSSREAELRRRPLPSGYGVAFARAKLSQEKAARALFAS